MHHSLIMTIYFRPLNNQFVRASSLNAQHQGYCLLYTSSTHVYSHNEYYIRGLIVVIRGLYTRLNRYDDVEKHEIQAIISYGVLKTEIPRTKYPIQHT